MQQNATAAIDPRTALPQTLWLVLRGPLHNRRGGVVRRGEGNVKGEELGAGMEGESWKLEQGYRLAEAGPGQWLWMTLRSR